MRAVDLATFVVNERYQYDKKVEVNHFTPRTGGGRGRRTTFCCCSAVLPHVRPIAVICSTSATERRPSHQSTSSDSLPVVLAPQLTTTAIDHSDTVSLHSREGEKDIYGEKERSNEGEREGGGKTKAVEDGDWPEDLS